MNFQTFFFDTYAGYFMQALPLALLAGGITAIIFRKRTGSGWRGMAWPSLFAAYLTGLLCLTLADRLINAGWYFLLYHQSSGMRLILMEWNYRFIPDPASYLRSAERIGNLLAFVPFGLLLPLAWSKAGWLRTVIVGSACSLGIELIQPFLGRSFDINDWILNTAGCLIGATVIWLIRQMRKKKIPS